MIPEIGACVPQEDVLIAPEWALGLFGFSVVEPVTARLVGAALFKIGGVSLFARSKRVESYSSLLTRKLSWSGPAVLVF